MRFSRWVVFTFAIHVLIVILDKGAGLILLKILEDHPDVKGAADMLTVLPSIMMAVANLGLATSTVFFLRKRKFDLEHVAQTTSLVAVVWGGAIALLAIVLSQTVLPLLKPEWDFHLAYVVPIALCVPFLLTTSYFNSLQLAVEKIRDYNLVNLLGSIVFLPLFLLFYYGVDVGAPTGIALARLASAVILALVTIWMLRTIVRWRPRMNWPFFKAGVTYGWKANLISVLTYLNHRLDLLLVPFLFLGVQGLTGETLTEAQFEQAAYYSLAVTFAELVWHFPEATRDLFFSKVAGSTHEEARRFTPILCRLCFAVAVLGGAAILLTVDPVMAVIMPDTWADTWAPTVLPSLTLLVPGAAAYTLAKILQNDLAARGRLNHCLFACALVLGIMLLLDFAWVPTDGALGAARASTIAYAASSIYTLFAYRSCGGVGPLKCLIPRRSDWTYVRELLDAIREKLWRRRK